jgi:thiol-disulfide isomerase/thioredoxin
MNRRHAAAIGAVALAAIAAGAGVAVWRSRPDASVPAGADLWSLAFQSLDGGALPMAGWRGQPLLLNFWATWCAPCVTEMPLLDRFAREHAAAGWRVLALAIDRADPVRRFVAERTLRLPIALGGADGIDLSRALGNEHGALPFTAVFDSSGDLAQHKLGAVSPELLARWLAEIR